MSPRMSVLLAGLSQCHYCPAVEIPYIIEHACGWQRQALPGGAAGG